MKNKVGAVLVAGGGIAGIQASLDLANSGYYVYLVEESPVIGGTMAQLDKTFPTNDCAMCIISPKLVECGRHLNIETITYSDIVEVEGQAGNFKVRIRKKPRFIDPSKCTGCADCAKECPVNIPDEFNELLIDRKSVYCPYPQAYPNVFTIQKMDRPPCGSACPAGINVQGYVALIREKKYVQAMDLMREKNPFPSICGRVCHHPCEDECRRGEVDEPVAIRALKRFAADQAEQIENQKSSDKADKNQKPTTDSKLVAIIGAGPAGLTAGSDLIKKGYKVTVFEKEPEPGGMLRWAIPDYRLPPSVVAGEIELLRRKGLDIRCSVSPQDVLYKNLKRKYDSVLLAVGAGAGRRMNIQGEDTEGVFDGLDFLKKIKTGELKKISGRIAVVGGGNTAIDCSRSALRMGASEVIIIYRRRREDMPGMDEEIKSALEEGINLATLKNPVEVKRTPEGKLSCTIQKMTLGKKDKSGRPRPVPVEGKTETLILDFLIMAVGQNIELPGDAPQNAKDVFVCGDCKTGPGTVVDAIASGHEAAESIDCFLKGIPVPRISEKAGVDLKLKEIPLSIERKFRPRIPTLSAEKRTASFDEIELCLTEEDALKEAQRCLDCGICSECMQCVEVCQAEAINHEMREEFQEINVGSIILSPGFETFNKNSSAGYANVVTSIQFERILSASGPYQGHIQRPSDGKEPKKIAFIQCVGSRDRTLDKNYCSSVCCMYSIKEAVIAKEHCPGVEPAIFYMDIRAQGKGFDEYYEKAKKESGVRFIASRVSVIKEMQPAKNLLIRYVAANGKTEEEEFDMVILSVGFEPCKSAGKFSRVLGIGLNEFGFAETGEFSPVGTSREGIFVCGAFSGPKDIPETVTQASGSAARSMALLSSSRGSLVKKKEYPPERDITGEEPRIGVFICHCGRNIGAFVDVPAVAEFVKTLPGVVYAEDNLYTCAQDTQDKIKKLIDEHKLNRIVVASCSPVTHEPLFQETLKEAGLNPYLFEMANIRNQCSWIHMTEPEKATEKAKNLVRMAIAKVRLYESLKLVQSKVISRALIIGGGLAGMSAALSLAEQNFEVYLIEKEKQLGGNLRRLRYTLSGNDPQEYLKRLEHEVKNNKLIHLFTNAEVTGLEGHKGNFKSKVRQKGKDAIDLNHGAIIVATGGTEYKPEEYFYGKNDSVITQLELEERLAVKGSPFSPETVAMIQCVGCRNEDRIYCSRVCCAQAIKNALKIKEINEKTEVYIFYKDIRTFGFKEVYYEKARKKGIIFLRYDDETKPEAENVDGQLKLHFSSAITGGSFTLDPGLLVLSAAIVPNENSELSKLLKVPLTLDGFFSEAHVKLRPVDFATEGIFLAGLAHSPKFIEESIAQAFAAASRAATILSKDYLEVGGVIAHIDKEKCSACLTCIRVCPYNVPAINDEGTVDIEAVECQGCGSCVSECPAKAIELHQFKDEQVIAQCQSLLCGGKNYAV